MYRILTDATELPEISLLLISRSELLTCLRIFQNSVSQIIFKRIHLIIACSIKTILRLLYSSIIYFRFRNPLRILNQSHQQIFDPMNTKIISSVVFISCLLISCSGGKVQTTKTEPVEEVEFYDEAASCDGSSDYNDDIDEDEIPPTLEPEITRLRFPNFTLLIHDFKGYETHGDFGNRHYYGQFGGGGESQQAWLNDDEMEDSNYIQTLIVVKDTVAISEILFDNRINNTLFEIVPVNKSDRFKISYCYLSRLNEIVDERNFSTEEMRNIDYEKLVHINEQTPYYPLTDSANLFFRARPHSPDMIEVTVKDGEVVPVNPNTPEQLNWEQNQTDQDFTRIKKKYHLRDTLVVIPGEYNTVATLTKENKLFGYGYDSFLFKIERYTNRDLVETKYVQIYIAYGC